MRKTAGKTIGLAYGLVILTLIGPLGCRRGPTPSPELQSLLASDTLDRQVADAQVRTAVRAFYAETGDTLAWSRNKPTSAAEAALAALASAGRHGLAPEDYQLSALRAERDLLARAAEPQRGNALAVFDLRLTSALIRLGRDVAVGRHDPRRIDSRWKPQRTMPPLGALLAASRADVAGWLETVQPRHAEYVALMGGLAALEGAQSKGGFPAVPRARLKPGGSHPAVAVLRRRLAASGDLGDASKEGTRYDAALKAALGVFQEHHGLPPTGRLDARTLAALNVPLPDRIAQVTLNLERWRWLPDDLGERHFRVNIPYFHLEAWEKGRLALDIRAVVGKQDNQTPVFSDRMTHVVLSPYWNIPPTIAADETVPAVANDPEFLSRQNIEVVRIAGNQATVVDPETLDWDDPPALEGLRFRQRPGSDNALGQVKFMFPNVHNVYVHDTPAVTLFGRLGRAFSHGCIRVEEPVALARYVLRDQSRWTPDAITHAMHAGTETHVKLREAIPIHIVYFTAWVDGDGGLHFRDDVYGLDARQRASARAAARKREAGTGGPAAPKPKAWQSGRPGPASATAAASPAA